MEKVQAYRFRNGRIIDHLNSVDIQEIVRVGGKIERFYEGVIYEKTYMRAHLEVTLKIC
jgi:protein subunit release factor A